MSLEETIEWKIMETSNWLWNCPKKTHNQIDDKLKELIDFVIAENNCTIKLKGTCDVS